MIRFVLKSTFWLGLLAMVLPLGELARDDASGFDVFGALTGAQQAVADMSGFCGRAPKACETGHDVALFAGERINEGARIAYGFVEGQLSDAALKTEADAEPGTDPLLTGAVPLQPLPRPYLPPKRGIDIRQVADTSAGLAPTAANRQVPVPSPRP